MRYLERAAVQSELEALSAETSDIRQARQDAQAAAARLNQYADRLNHRHPTAILAEVARTAATFDIRLETFEQTQAGLTADLQADGASAGAGPWASARCCTVTGGPS